MSEYPDRSIARSWHYLALIQSSCMLISNSTYISKLFKILANYLHILSAKFTTSWNAWLLQPGIYLGGNNVERPTCGLFCSNALFIDDLMLSCYTRVSRLARSMVKRIHQGLLAPSELISEAYIRLRKKHRIRWPSLEFFFSDLRLAMRDVLVDLLRKKLSLKRGGDREHVPCDVCETIDMSDPIRGEVIAALNDLALSHAYEADFVRLHYYQGLSVAEIATLKSVSHRSVQRVLSSCRTKLREILTSDDPGGLIGQQGASTARRQS